ncbi:MAG: hypothetical protein JNM18_25155 [Planctomycetaceae bacterium]|nr:hypothetical protein [Planctomycetaceae bacterium]
MKRLKEKLKRTPFLVVDVSNGTLALVERNKAASIISERPAGTYMMDLLRGAENFQSLNGSEDRLFSVGDLAVIGGQQLATINDWLRGGYIQCSVRPSAGSGRGRERKASFEDAFVCGTIGALRRAGVALSALAGLKELLQDQVSHAKASRK